MVLPPGRLPPSVGTYITPPRQRMPCCSRQFVFRCIVPQLGNNCFTRARRTGPRCSMSLLDAALLGHAKAVQTICDSRRYARQAALRGELDSTALHAACEHGHEAVVRILLQRSRELLDVPNRLCQTPLHISCERGHLSCARLLVDAAADDAHCRLLDSADSSGLTALMRASVGGSAALVELLVSRGAALDRIDQVGMTALFRTCVAGHTACLDLLLAARATLQPNVEGAKPLVAVLQRVRPLLAILSA